jgi:hypothetical protein
MVLLVSGWASTSCVDAEDHSFEPDAIRWLSFGGLVPPIELLYQHNKHAPCGKITTLERRATKDGTLGLWCEASVYPFYAVAPFTGFSVRTAVERYEIKQGPKGPYANIKSAVLLDVSLVPKPCNPDCVIQSREEFNELTPYTVEAYNKLRALQMLVEQAMRAQR